MLKIINRVIEAKNYYDVFELPVSATTEEVTEAYEKLLPNVDPEKFHNSLKAKKAQKKVKAAYTVLTNETERRRYNYATGLKVQLSEAKAVEEMPSKYQIYYKSGPSTDKWFYPKAFIIVLIASILMNWPTIMTIHRLKSNIPEDTLREMITFKYDIDMKLIARTSTMLKSEYYIPESKFDYLFGKGNEDLLENIDRFADKYVLEILEIACECEKNEFGIEGSKCDKYREVSRSIIIDEKPHDDV